MDKRLGYNIRKIRELRGLDQKAVAEHLGIDKSTYSDLEAGKTKIAVERLKKIAELLETTPRAIEKYDEAVIFHIINHQGNAGQITINNASFEEIAKVLTEPYKNQLTEKDRIIAEKNQQLALLEQEIRYLKGGAK